MCRKKAIHWMGSTPKDSMNIWLNQPVGENLYKHLWTLQMNQLFAYLWSMSLQPEQSYAIFGISFAVMIYFIAKGSTKWKSAIIDNAPKIAGSDVITGRAKNPQQFDDPDDDALDEIAKLLDEDDKLICSKPSSTILRPTERSPIDNIRV